MSKQLLVKDLRVGYPKPGKQQLIVLDHISAEIRNAGITCLMGPNGSGKSSLLRCICGLEKPLHGNILIDGISISSLSRKEISELISIVLTEVPQADDLSVYALVAMGRYPYSGWLGRLNKEDHDAVEHAINATGIRHLVKMTLSELSDGEKQIAMIARALAQQTPFIIMDEPTAFLDIPNKIHIMKLLRSLAKTENKCIIMATHDFELAIESADHVWLISAASKFYSGLTEDLAMNHFFEKIFDKNELNFDTSSGRFVFPHVSASSKIFLASENETAFFWTSKALQKAGFECVRFKHNEEPGNNIPYIAIQPGNKWKLIKEEENHIFHSIETLIQKLQL